MTLDLESRHVVITGGSGGIGSELVRQASKAGANVIFSYNSGVDRASELESETGASPFHLALGRLGPTRTFLQAVANSGHVDYFIANAGRELSGDLRKHTYSEIRDNVDANLSGNLFLLQAIITGQFMVQAGQVSVIGSIAADGNHDQLAYSASKAGLRGAVESLSRYDAMVKEQGLGVKLLEPVFVRTPMAERTLKILERRVVKPKGGDELVEQFREEAVLSSEYVAQEILRLTVDSSVTGVRTIPEGANLHDIRAKYF